MSKKRLLTTAAADLSDEEFARYLVDTLGLRKCAFMLEEFFWSSSLGDGKPSPELNAMLRPFGLRVKLLDEYPADKPPKVLEIHEIGTDTYVGSEHVGGTPDIALNTGKRATVDNMTAALRVCMDIDSGVLEGIATEYLTEMLGASHTAADHVAEKFGAVGRSSKKERLTMNVKQRLIKLADDYDVVDENGRDEAIKDMLAHLDAARQNLELTVNHANALLVSYSDDALYALSNALDDVRREVDDADEYVRDMINYVERGV